MSRLTERILEIKYVLYIGYLCPSFCDRPSTLGLSMRICSLVKHTCMASCMGRRWRSTMYHEKRYISNEATGVESGGRNVPTGKDQSLAHFVEIYQVCRLFNYLGTEIVHCVVTLLLTCPPTLSTCSTRPQHTRQSALLRTRNRQRIHALDLDPHPRVHAVVAR